MTTTDSGRIDIPADLPAYLAEKLRSGYVQTRFRLAADHQVQYFTLIAAAFDDIRPIVDWYAKMKQIDQVIEWLNNNTPDCVERVIIIARLLDMKDKRSSAPHPLLDNDNYVDPLP